MFQLLLLTFLSMSGQALDINQIKSTFEFTNPTPENFGKNSGDAEMFGGLSAGTQIRFLGPEDVGIGQAHVFFGAKQVITNHIPGVDDRLLNESFTRPGAPEVATCIVYTSGERVVVESAKIVVGQASRVTFLFKTDWPECIPDQYPPDHVIVISHTHPMFEIAYVNEESGADGSRRRPLSDDDIRVVEDLSRNYPNRKFVYRAVVPSGYTYVVQARNGKLLKQ